MADWIVNFSLRKHPFLLRSTPLGKRPQRRRAKEKRMLSQAKSILVKYTYNLQSSRLSTQVSQALWEILSTQVSQALWEIPLFSTGTVDVV